MEKSKFKIIAIVSLSVAIVVVLYFILSSEIGNTSKDYTDKNQISTEEFSNEQEVVSDSNNNNYYEIKSENIIEINEAEYADSIPLDYAKLEKQIEVSNTYEGKSKAIELVRQYTQLSSRNKGINRYKLAEMLFRIIEAEGKLPNISGYVMNYEDNDTILLDYTDAIRYTTYLKLYDFGARFDGYKPVTQAEIDSSMEKLEQYLSSTDKIVRTDYKNKEKFKEDVGTIKDNPELNKEVEDRDYSDDKYKDRLNGESVAIHKNPKSAEEIQENIDNIRRIDLEEIGEKEFNSDQVVYVDYLNKHEGLVEYSLLDTIQVDDMLLDVVGITYSEKESFKVSTLGVLKKYESTETEFGWNNYFLYSTEAVGIKNGKVVTRGNYVKNYSVQTEPYITFDSNVDIDHIGIVVSKSVLDSTDTLEGPLSEEYVVVAIPVVR